MKQSLVRAVVVLLLAASSVGIVMAAPVAQSALPPEMLDVEWALASLQPSGGAAEDTTGLGLTLTLAADGGVGGSGGCNRFVSGWTAGDNQGLSFSVIAGTLIACEQPIAEREQRYYKSLEAVSSYRLEGGRLILKSGDSGELVYTSTGGQPAQLPATGAAGWSLLLVLAAIASVAAGLAMRRAGLARAPGAD